MYRQIYRDKLLYYPATQSFNFQKTLQQNPNSQIRRPYPGGTPPFVRRDSCYSLVLLMRVNELLQ